MCPTGTSEIWAGELVCALITDALREEKWEQRLLHSSSSSSATMQATGDEARAGGNPDASFSSGITTFKGKRVAKMHFKPGRS